jgi:3-hydroxyacyl-CoA dehydrogenase
VIVSRAHQLAYAKECALDLWNKGYTKPPMRKDIKVLGQEGLGIVYVGANSMQSGNYISEHDALISQKLGLRAGAVRGGFGTLSEATEVSEQYLLDLERKAFPGAVHAARRRSDPGLQVLSVFHHRSREIVFGS